MDNTADGRLTADVVADLTRRAEYAATPVSYDLEPDTSLVLRTLRDDEQVQVLDLERHLNSPRRPRGTAHINEPSDFATYVNRLSTTNTTVWVTEDQWTVTAMFNDHEHGYGAGWRDHSAVLYLQRDPDWHAWVTRDEKLMTQEQFAEHLESQTHAIQRPDAATMLEIATTFQAHRDASFSRGTRLDSGDVQLAWHEETTAKAGSSGRLEIPAEFTITLAPFLGVTATEITARLRWRIRDGKLGIGYKLHRPDVVQRQAFSDIRAMLTEQLASPVLLGAAPSTGRS